MIKKFVKRKIWKIPVWLIIILLGVSVAAGAIMFTLKIPSTVTILPPAEGHYEIGVYWDAECTEEVTFLDFGELKMGSKYTITVYIKSLSDVDITVHAVGYGGMNFDVYLSPNPWMHMTPNEVRIVDIVIATYVMGESGTYNFDTVFNVYPTQA